MHPLRLIRIALEAEGVRLHYLARRMLARCVMGLLALLLLLAALVFGHIAAWCWLNSFLPPQHAALVVGGVDLLLAVILIALAGRASPGPAEREARAVRQRALEGAAQSVSVTSLLLRLVALLTRSR
jgi:hypothetical protein